MLAYSSLCAASTKSLSTIENSWLIVGLLTATYFAPALVAFFRCQQNRWFILALNFLFGWTLVGWIICLAWAARAPSGETVFIVQPAPQHPRASTASLLPGATFSPPTPTVSEDAPFRIEQPATLAGRRPQSIKLFLLRLAVAAIALAVVAGVTASQWKPSTLSSLSMQNRRIHHVPQVRNIDPYAPIVPSSTPQRRYPSPVSQSHAGYY
jgi:hypothetical protein